MSKINFAVYLDDFVDEIFYHEWEDDSPSGHHVVFSESKKEDCIQKMLNRLKPLLEKIVYESDDYGYELK